MRCECEARDPGPLPRRTHGRMPEGCRRPHGHVIASPALCMACMFGCTDLDIAPGEF